MTPAEVRFLTAARSGVLATIDPSGRPRLVPVCFVVHGPTTTPAIWSPIDDKPKRVTDPHRLARVRDIVERPAVSLLVERWDEDWAWLAWLRVHGTAEIVDGDPDRTAILAALRVKYPQYADHDLEGRPMIRIVPTAATSWGDLEGPEASSPPR